MADIPTKEPTKITAGDLIQWTRRDLSASYPASEYTLTYYLLKTGQQIAITATADGDHFRVAVDPTDSETWEAGKYKWQAFVSKTGERFNVDHGSIEILPNFAALSSGIDFRSSAEKTLEAIEAVIEGRASKSQESYSIAGRSLARTSIPDLLLLRDRYRVIVDREKQAERIRKGGSSRNRVTVRFVR